MTQAFNLALLANAVDTSGRLNVGTNATGTLPVANGGTGASTLTANNVLLGNGTSALQAVAPGTNGNYLRSNGTTWVSQAGATGTVSSVATGNGLSGGTITTTGTLTIACPASNSVGSTCTGVGFGGGGGFGGYNYGSNYAAGTAGGQVNLGSGGPLTGTWRWFANNTGALDANTAVGGFICKVS